MHLIQPCFPVPKMNIRVVLKCERQVTSKIDQPFYLAFNSILLICTQNEDTSRFKYVKAKCHQRSYTGFTFITGELLARSCFSRKVSVGYTKRGGISVANSFGVNLHLFLIVYQDSDWPKDWLIICIPMRSMTII